MTDVLVSSEAVGMWLSEASVGRLSRDLEMITWDGQTDRGGLDNVDAG